MPKNKVENNLTPCWEARLNTNKTGVELGDKLTISQSVFRVSSGKDVMCDNQISALSVTIAFPIFAGPEIDKYQGPGNTFGIFNKMDKKEIKKWK